MPDLAPLPLQSAVLDLDDAGKPVPGYTLSREYAIWLQQSLIPRTEAPAQILTTVTLTAQAASIALTPVPLSTITAGLYRVSWYTRVTQAATTDSSLAITITWTESAATCTNTGAAVTGNLTTSTQSGSVVLRSDGNAPIDYSTTYASTGATVMQYRIDVIVEFIG